MIELCEENIPSFHTRLMRQTLFSKYGRVAPTMKRAVMRSFYRELTARSFWDERRKFIQEHIGAAVDDRCHDTVTHMACAISVCDLVDQVKVCVSRRN